jgi:hypothetical protein
VGRDRRGNVSRSGELATDSPSHDGLKRASVLGATDARIKLVAMADAAEPARALRAALVIVGGAVWLDDHQ